MKRKILFSALLLGMILFNNQSESLAATTATQNITATLGTVKSVTATGTALTSGITELGATDTQMNPSFRITSNTPQDLTLKATVSTFEGNTPNVLFTQGGNYYVAVGNTNSASQKPTDDAVTNNILSGSPTADQNANIIAYQITPPTNVVGKITFTYNASHYWDVAVVKNGTYNTNWIIPAGGALDQTYSGDDEAGPYVATYTMSFTTP